MSTNHSRPTILAAIPPNYNELVHRAWERHFASWSDYANEDSFHQAACRETERAVWSLARGLKTPRLIDLGSGTGRFLRDIRERHAWSHLAGVDFCAEAIRLARQLDLSGGPSIAFVVGDLEQPVPAPALVKLGRFDLAVSAFVADEVMDMDAFFRAAHSFLVAGGRFVCAMLDEARERERHGLPASAGGHDVGGTMIKQVKTDNFGVEIEYYRIIRSRAAPIEAAVRAGFRMQSDRSISPEALSSRRDGPALRLLEFIVPPAA